MMLDGEYIEDFSDDVVHEALNIHGLVIKSRRSREDHCSGLCKGEHVAKVDHREGGLSRDDDQWPVLL